MPSLMAILGLDAKQFEGGMKTAQLHASRAGQNISHSLAHPIKEAMP
jgi:hypothetical protein